MTLKSLLLNKEEVDRGDGHGDEDRPDNLVGAVEEDRIGDEGRDDRHQRDALLLAEHIPGDPRQNQADAAHHAGHDSLAGKVGDFRHAAAQAEDHHQHGGQQHGADVVAQILLYAGDGDGFGLTRDGRDRAGEQIADRADQIGKSGGLQGKAARLRVEQLRNAVDDDGDDSQYERADVAEEFQSTSPFRQNSPSVYHGKSSLTTLFANKIMLKTTIVR